MNFFYKENGRFVNSIKNIIKYQNEALDNVHTHGPDDNGVSSRRSLRLIALKSRRLRSYGSHSHFEGVVFHPDDYRTNMGQLQD